MAVLAADLLDPSEIYSLLAQIAKIRQEAFFREIRTNLNRRM